VGDVDADGRADIVITPYAGGPHVRIFNGDATVKNPGFFAYDQSLRGGVNVAVGDVDADGRADIITAPATGSSQVRVFDGAGNPMTSFFAYNESFRGGLSLGMILVK